MSDHAPLKHIFDNSKAIRENVSARLQRWQIALRAHSFKVETCSGQSMHLPGTLSRLPYEEELQVSVVDQYFTQEQEVIPLYDIIKQVSYQDAGLNKLKRFVVNGWPARLPEKLRIYGADTAQYSFHDGCIYKGFRLVVPHILRTRVLELVHEGHIGIERMCRLLRTHFWWPKCDVDVSNFVTKCIPFQKARKTPINKDLRSWLEASHPFEKSAH